MGRVLRERDVEQLVGIRVPFFLDQQLRNARLNDGMLSVGLQPLDHLPPTAGVPVQCEPLVPRISVQRVELDHLLQAFARDRKSTRLKLQSLAYLVCRLLLEKKKTLLILIDQHAQRTE